MSTIDTRPHSARRDAVDTGKPHYWLERHDFYKVRHGSWVFVGFSCKNVVEAYLYWSGQTNEKPKSTS